MQQQMIARVVEQVVAALAEYKRQEAGNLAIPVGISSRHIHLSAGHLDSLFGCGHTLTPQKELSQTGQFAAAETVTLVGPKGVIRGVRVLGPVRKATQVEISRSDGFSLGITPPLRDSGDVQNSSGIVVVGSCGAVTLTEGVICAARHIHMHTDDARRFGVKDNDRVAVEIRGERGGIYHNVLVRVSPSSRLEFHIDTDEANAVGLKNKDEVVLVRHKEA
ncbi:Phosphate propanoyltransferase [Propionispora sp. 2/2-37]|nr:Phosphate propanoyltransferase [Propionispora sp. 2/2-37]